MPIPSLPTCPGCGPANLGAWLRDAKPHRSEKHDPRLGATLRTRRFGGAASRRGRDPDPLRAWEGYLPSPSGGIEAISVPGSKRSSNSPASSREVSIRPTQCLHLLGDFPAGMSEMRGAQRHAGTRKGFLSSRQICPRPRSANKAFAVSGPDFLITDSLETDRQAQVDRNCTCA